MPHQLPAAVPLAISHCFAGNLAERLLLTGPGVSELLVLVSLHTKAEVLIIGTHQRHTDHALTEHHPCQLVSLWHDIAPNAAWHDESGLVAAAIVTPWPVPPEERRSS